MRLKDFRTSAGFTQRELARKAGISRSSVSHVENGRYPPSPMFSRAVCRALGEELGLRIHTWNLFPDHFKPLEIPSNGKPDSH